MLRVARSDALVGEVLQLGGQTEKARAHYRHATELGKRMLGRDPNNLAARDLLAIVEAKVGLPVDAGPATAFVLAPTLRARCRVLSYGQSNYRLKDLEGGIEALSSAVRAFRLTPFERGAYHALMVSVYVTTWAAMALLVLGALAGSEGNSEEVALIGGNVIVGGGCLATVALVLNIPLASKLYRERGRLKERGLASLEIAVEGASAWAMDKCDFSLGTGDRVNHCPSGCDPPYDLG